MPADPGVDHATEARKQKGQKDSKQFVFHQPVSVDMSSSTASNSLTTGGRSKTWTKPVFLL